MSGETAFILDITEHSSTSHRTYGTFRIIGRLPAMPQLRQQADMPEQGEQYSLTRVTPRTTVMDYGDKRTLPLVITAREIAEDLCREINSEAGERSFLGVFVCA